MNKRVYQIVTIIIGVSLILVATLVSIDQLLTQEIGVIILFTLLSSVLERMTIPLKRGYLSLSFAFLLCMFYVFGNVILPIWIVIMGILISQLIFHKRKLVDALFNVSIISISAIAGAAAFKGLGGNWGEPSQLDFAPMLVMVLVILAVNHIILGAFYRLVDKNFDLSKYIKEIKWDGLTYLITVPLGILMALAYSIGLIGVLVIFVPLVASSYIFRLYKKVDQLNNQLNGIYEVATEINSNLEMDKVMETIGKNLYEILKVDSFYIFLVEDNYLKSAYSKGAMVDYLEENNLEIGQGATGYCAKHKVTVLIQDASKDERAFFVNPERGGGAILAVPLLRQGKLIGVISGVRKQKNSFTKTDVLILEILANQAAVALDNAKTFKEIENMAILDDLTKVYNYRYFQQKIHQEVEKAALEGTAVSLMVIDLDNFKRINDTHGHTTGNRILIELAQEFRKSIRKYDVLFRYGGDEFVVVFPNTNKDVAEVIAERILENVNNTVFGKSEGIDESVTFSAGIAEFPTDAEDHLDLMRKADRIMYLGSKEKGKNKITVYAK